jgi:hypothetical protein
MGNSNKFPRLSTYKACRTDKPYSNVSNVPRSKALQTHTPQGSEEHLSQVEEDVPTCETPALGKSQRKGIKYEENYTHNEQFSEMLARPVLPSCARITLRKSSPTELFPVSKSVSNKLVASPVLWYSLFDPYVAHMNEEFESCGKYITDAFDELLSDNNKGTQPIYQQWENEIVLTLQSVYVKWKYLLEGKMMNLPTELQEDAYWIFLDVLDTLNYTKEKYVHEIPLKIKSRNVQEEQLICVIDI